MTDNPEKSTIALILFFLPLLFLSLVCLAISFISWSWVFAPGYIVRLCLVVGLLLAPAPFIEDLNDS